MRRCLSDLRSRCSGGRGALRVGFKALAFSILTAARTGETIGARWEEIDLKERTWTIPSERMKATKEHRVALSGPALEILNALPREEGNQHLFIGPRCAGLSNMSMTSVLRRMNRADITVHGFRSTFRDWASETTAYPSDVIEQALAHTVGSKVERAYRRGDVLAKRARLMAEWARFCARPAEISGELIALNRNR
jgi:integrase